MTISPTACLVRPASRSRSRSMRCASNERGAISRPMRSASMAFTSSPASRSDAASVRMRAICACDPAAVVGSWTSSTTSNPLSTTTSPSAGARQAAAQLDRLLLRLDVALADVLVGRRGIAVGLRLVARRRRRRPHGLRGRHRGAEHQALHALVVRGELRQLGDELVEEIEPPRVARDAGHLLLDLDRLGGLADLREGAREEAERVEVARVRLEADLQLGERLHPVRGRPLREVELRGGARVRDVGLVVEEPLEDLDRVVLAAELRELAGGDGELADRVVDLLGARQRFGQAEVRERVGRVEIDDLAEDLDRLVVAVLALEARRDLVERGQGVADEPELLIELGELGGDVRVLVLEGGDVARDRLADLLVDRDGLQRKALLRVELSHALVGRDGRAVLLGLELEVSQLQQGPCVVRILLDDPFVLDHRLVVLLLLDVLLGGGEYLFAVNRHDLGCS